MHGNVIKVVGLFVAMVFGMTGCGGNGEGSKASTLTVSGTASEGALITGKTVRLKDANGNAAVDTTTNTTTGSYSIDVTNLTAPFLVTVTGTNGTYVSLAQAAGTANINPITTTVVSLAAGSPDVSALFAGLTLAQLTAINTNYIAKSELVSTSLHTVLPTGVKAEDYFTGTVTVSNGIDAVFDTYKITVHPADGITIKTKDAGATTVLSIPAATIISNTNAPLPAITVPDESLHYPYVSQLIINFKNFTTIDNYIIQALSARAGLELTYLSAMSGNSHLFKMSKYMTYDEAIVITNKLREDPNVNYADPNSWVSINPINPIIPPITITTGVRGNVWYWDGNFMPFVYSDIPSSTVQSSRGKITPVVREIQIHRVTTVSDMNSYGPLFSNIPTELVATTTSDETGFYQIDLPPGTYSVFIKEGTKYYANGSGSQGIMAFEVRSGTVTEMRLDITLAASF